MEGKQRDKAHGGGPEQLESGQMQGGNHRGSAQHQQEGAQQETGGT